MLILEQFESLKTVHRQPPSEFVDSGVGFPIIGNFADLCTSSMHQILHIGTDGSFIYNMHRCVMKVDNERKVLFSSDFVSSSIKAAEDLITQRGTSVRLDDSTWPNYLAKLSLHSAVFSNRPESIRIRL